MYTYIWSLRKTFLKRARTLFDNRQWVLRIFKGIAIYVSKSEDKKHFLKFQLPFNVLLECIIHGKTVIILFSKLNLI